MATMQLFSFRTRGQTPLGSRLRGAQLVGGALVASAFVLSAQAGANDGGDTYDGSESEFSVYDDQEEYQSLGTLGPFLSESDVRYHVRNAGFPEHLVETMIDIAHCESSFGVNSYAWGGGNRHTGLFQISDLHHHACGYGQQSLDTFRDRMTDPGLNSQCAYRVYVNAGYSLNPWDCYYY